MTMEEDKSYQELKWTDRPLYTTFNSQHEKTPSSPPSLHLHTSQDQCGSPNKPARSPIPIHAESTALLVVDVQPEYWSNCSPVRKDFPHFPQNLTRLLSTCRARKTKIIWVRADYKYAHSPWLIQFSRLHGNTIPPEVPCDPLTDSVTWETFATPIGGEVIITKKSWSSTSNTALMDCLKAWNIDTVLVCGLITSVCVQHSAFGIFEAGYRTILVTDCCADRGRARHEAALALYGDYMYELVTSECLGREKGGILPAQPVWLTVDAKTKMVTAISLTRLDEIGGRYVTVEADEKKDEHNVGLPL